MRGFMRYQPIVGYRAGRYYGRLNASGLGAESVTEISVEFDTAEEALAELMVRLRHVYQRGDSIELGDRVFDSVMDVERVLLDHVAQRRPRGG
jgi:hypothetical protein